MDGACVTLPGRYAACRRCRPRTTFPPAHNCAVATPLCDGAPLRAPGPDCHIATVTSAATATTTTCSADMFPGDEDNGSMGAWHVLNALGVYPLNPASGNYTVGSPLFAQVTVAIDGGAPLVIRATNQAPANVYVQGLTWNGAPVAGVMVRYADLAAGGVLQFEMGPAPAGARGGHAAVAAAAAT